VSNGATHHALLLASGDTVLVRIYPESAVSIATSKREVIPIRVNRIPLNEKRASGIFASGCAVYEFGDDSFVGHGVYWLRYQFTLVFYKAWFDSMDMHPCLHVMTCL